MKFNNLVSLSVTAAALLHYGTFVNASPFFHFNDVAPADNCQDVRITFPASQDLVFEDSSKHVVAWQIPTDNTATQVNLTLVNDNNQVSYLGTYDASRGASDEVPFNLGNAEPGQFHVHLSTIGGNSDCQVDSSPFKIEKRAEMSNTEAAAPTADQQQEDQQQQQEQQQQSATTQEEPASDQQSSGHVDDQQLEKILEEITTDKHINDSDDDKLENIMNGIDKSETTDGNAGSAQSSEDAQEIERILQEIAKDGENQTSQGKTPDNNENDQQLEQIVQDITNSSKGSSQSHNNDQEIEKIVEDIANNEKSAHNNDAEIDKIVQDIAKKSSKASHNNDAEIDKIIQDIAKDGKLSSHNDDAEVDEIVQGIAKQSSSSRKGSDSKNWDEMINELDQYLDNDKKEKSQAPHKNAVADGEPSSEIKTFDDYIRSLDQDYTKYIHNNKATEKERVTHKNSVGSDPIGPPQHVDSPYFTNEDRRTHSNSAKVNGASHIDSPYFTNEDRRTHGNSGSASHVDAANPYFTNEDHRTHGNNRVNAELDEMENDHSDAVEGWSAEEIPAHEQDWHDESTIADIPDHSNEGEWIAEEYDEAPVHDKIEVDPHLNDIMEGQWTEIGDDGVAIHPDATEWQAEEVELDNDYIADHSNDFVEGQWMEIGSENDQASHADAAEWQTEEIDSEDDYIPQHSNVVENQWTDEVEQEPSHANEWHAEEAQGHSDGIVENQWTEIGDNQEPAHADSAEQWQAEEIQDDSDNNYVSTWHSEGAEDHDNIASIWQSADADQHDNVAEWQSEVVDEHGNVAENQWTETGEENDNEALHQDATEWQTEEIEDVPEQHSDDIIENQWTEIGNDSQEQVAVAHDDAAEWQTEEIEPETETGHVNSGWHEDSPIFGGGQQSSHVDGGVPILSAEQFIS